MTTYNIIVNKVSGEQVVYVLSETGSYTLGSDTLVWDELADGEAIDENAVAWTDAQIQANIGRFTRETSPSLHLLSGGYIAGHLAAVEASYAKVIEVWQLKFELDARALLDDVDAAVIATYATVPINEIRWEQKRYIASKGVLWDVIQDELAYTNTQMIELWDESSLWDGVAAD
jgi:hypothetical protein